MLILDKRLSLIASYVRLDGATVCDIGTDHALLPCFLREKGVDKVIATDISDGPLATAKRTCDFYGITGIELVKSDGLENILHADDLIIAGMGGELIARMVGECAEKNFTSQNFRLILQPMTHPEKVRNSLYKNGYEIVSEKAVEDKGKHYCVIYAKFSGEYKSISQEFAFWGKMEDEIYINYRKNKINKILKNLQTAQKNSKNQEEKIRLNKLLEYRFGESDRGGENEQS